MKHVGTFRKKLSALKLPGDWKRRLKDPGVIALSQSFDTIPLLQRPGIAAAGNELIYGGDRAAALSLRGDKEIEVDVWDASPAEIRVARAAENARRRGAGPEAFAELADAHAALKAEQEPEPENPFSEFSGGDAGNHERPSGNSPRKTGRPKSDATKAREVVAKATGRSVQAIRMVQQRAAAKVDAAAPSEAPTGWSIQGSMPAGGLAWRAAVAKASSLLSQAKGTITAALNADPALGDRFNIAGLQQAIEDVGNRVRSLEPWGACCYCKGTTHRRNCQPCHSMDWLTHDQARDVPADLCAEGDDAVVPVAGKHVPWAEVDRA